MAAALTPENDGASAHSSTNASALSANKAGTNRDRPFRAMRRDVIDTATSDRTAEAPITVGSEVAGNRARNIESRATLPATCWAMTATATAMSSFGDRSVTRGPSSHEARWSYQRLLRG